MMIIRGAQPDASAGAPTEADAVTVNDPLHVWAAEEFADDVAAGRTPSIRARLHVGQRRAQQVRAHLTTLT